MELVIGCYRSFGMNIRSEVPLPELDPADGEPDVEICLGRVPEQLDNPSVVGVRYQAKLGALLLKVDGIARYLVLDSTRIVVDACEGATPEEVRLFLLGSAFGALLIQRGSLPLHGSSLVHDGEAALFLGASGQGKSSLAAVLNVRGYQLISDDIAAISTDSGRPCVLPSGRNVKVWRDTLELLGISSTGLRRVRPQLEKYYLPSAGPFHPDAKPVKRVYVLSSANSPAIEIVKVKGMEKMECVVKNTYRPTFIQGLARHEVHFNSCALVAQYAEVMRINRPRFPFMLQELADTIERDLV
jgi:hypothetical protein